MPDHAQVVVRDARSKPDFAYDTGPTAVFIDGPHHDGPAQTERDAAAEDRLIDLGWTVIRFRHDDDWAAVAARLPSVFGGPAPRSPARESRPRERRRWHSTDRQT